MTDEQRTHAAQIEAQGNDNSAALAQLAGMIADPATQREALHRPELDAVPELLTEQEKQAARIAERIIEEREHFMLSDSLNVALTDEGIASPERLAYVASVIEQVDARLKEAGIAPDERTTKEAVFYGLETFDHWGPTEEAANDAAVHTCLILGVIDEAEANRLASQFGPPVDPELWAEAAAIEQAEAIGIAQYEAAERVRISPKAAAAIQQLATIIPAVDREPSEADVTRHMMTGEEPRSWTVADVRAHRFEHGGKEATQRAADQSRDASAARRDSQRRDYDLER